MKGEVRIKGGREHQLGSATPGVYEIDLKKNEEVVLYFLTNPILNRQER
jgi:hypothetical protein